MSSAELSHGAVVHVITTMARGGAQRTALEIAARLHRPDRPQYLIAGAPGDLDDEARARLGSRFVRARSLSNAVSVLGDVCALSDVHAKLSRIAHGRPIVVHTHSLKAGLVGRLAGRAVHGARLVHMLHGFAFDVVAAKSTSRLLQRAGPSLVCAVERVAAAAGDLQLFVSAADMATATRLRIGRPERSRLVRAGVDAARFTGATRDRAERARVRRDLDVDDDALLAVTVGNLKPQKDPLLHVEILRAWRALSPGAHLVFLGDGPLRGQMIARARDLGVHDALLLPGAVPDARPYLAAADVMLLASAWEGMPMSVLEGIAAGLAVVVRDAGWGAELAWAPAQTLVRLPVDAAAARFAAALAHVCRGAPPVVVELPSAFTLEGMLAELSEIYDEILAG